MITTVKQTARRGWPALALCLLLLKCGPDAAITGRDGAEMRLIPGSEFQMGGTLEELEGYEHRDAPIYRAERPLHKVRVSSFYMDRHEVTNARYRGFLQSVAGAGSAAVDHPDQPEDQDHERRYVGPDLLGDEQPAAGVSWFDAYAYCKWAGRRLPTEAEWEFAARGGGDYAVYPWGSEEPDAEGGYRANYHPPRGSKADGYEKTAPVGSFPEGASPFGMLDMAGNAEEWVQDWLDLAYYATTEGAADPQGPQTGKQRVIKGGSYMSAKHLLRVAARLHGPPEAKGPQLGFRCARDL